jgi:DNA polymerase III epsilon subunit-like protein
MKNFTLYAGIRRPLLSTPPKNDWKKRKIKFSIKIKIFKIRGIGYQIAKNIGELKCTFHTNLKATTYFTHPFHISPLFFNLALHPKKIMQLGANWVSNGTIVQNKSSRTNLNFLINPLFSIQPSILKKYTIRC